MSESGWKFVNDLAKARQYLNVEKTEIQTSDEVIDNDLEEDTSMNDGDEQ